MADATGTPAVPYAHRLAAFATAARDEPLPPPVTADVLGRILDTVGNCLAALAQDDDAEAQAAVGRVARRAGGVPEASVIGSAERLPADRAALLTGTLAHALDFDDTHLPSVLHPSASVVPAALAAGEAAGASGRELIAAVAAGGEVCVRLGVASYDAALRNSVFFEKGLHATSICGTVGAAVAAGLLYGLDGTRLADAIGIACSLGGGIIEANRTGGTVKRVHCGWAAHAGVSAAQLAAEGITGPPTVLEGRFGFFRAYLDDAWQAGPFLARLDRMDEAGSWELLRTVFKPYPSNHFTHPGIDCALALRAAGLHPDAVKSAELGVAAAPLRTVGAPRELKIRPTTPYHAKFSGPYTVASALIGGGGLGLHLDDFSPEAFADPRRLALAEKVSVVVDEQCDEEFPRSFSAVLRVRTYDGRHWEHRVRSSRGGPGSPLTLNELETKYRLNAARVLPEEAATALASRIRALPGRGDLHGLLPTHTGRFAPGGRGG
ncbi:MmgE/PrpD family protein [Streptomyces gobiensis]|uniref:MmgE/PrpD family protein n=1 Tax=Streptomyces gobiensis TaxID=2875706 RepID=UPI001E635C3B|nr:MmgE/PrpD family protein [Streptomyces gobiensis]UGY91921.1 MmgE/PrpD family protein [Streptomyces gobiensis]